MKDHKWKSLSWSLGEEKKKKGSHAEFITPHTKTNTVLMLDWGHAWIFIQQSDWLLLDLARMCVTGQRLSSIETARLTEAPPTGSPLIRSRSWPLVDLEKRVEFSHPCVSLGQAHNAVLEKSLKTEMGSDILAPCPPPPNIMVWFQTTCPANLVL